MQCIWNLLVTVMMTNHLMNSKIPRQGWYPNKLTQKRAGKRRGGHVQVIEGFGWFIANGRWISESYIIVPVNFVYDAMTRRVFYENIVNLEHRVVPNDLQRIYNPSFGSLVSNFGRTNDNKHICLNILIFMELVHWSPTNTCNSCP